MTEVLMPPIKETFDAVKLVNEQRSYFDSKITLSYSFRIEQLKKLRNLVAENEQNIMDALHADLRKSSFEAYGTEVGFILGEIDHTIKHLKKWMKPKRVGTPLFHAIGSSKIYSDPYGVTLIIAPWNYPFQLLVGPLIGAMAAGNTAVLKPSELAPHTAQLVNEMIGKTFDKKYISVVMGAVEESKALLEQRFDYIFFTGGVEIGRYVYQCAARHLTPVTLELGGKSPCFVDENINLEVASRRILWGKFTNAGQTCVAPDYLLVDEKIKDKLLDKMQTHLKEFFGENPQLSVDYGRIINERHFDRISGLIEPDKVVVGGKTDKSDLYISPTILDKILPSDPIMNQEIFGPVLPVIAYKHLDEAIKFVNDREKPLAFYVFTESSNYADKVLAETSGGGGCVNDTLMHLGNVNLPFGGVGESGIGAYHGGSSFDTFSHKKSVHKKSTISDLKIRYAPYKNNLPILKKLMKWLN
ncbi:MAG: aldehyde dehydrogenase [Chitinophagales bacterium]|nr:aldehyde dehydrogenase [Chitinophagales bacterium]